MKRRQSDENKSEPAPDQSTSNGSGRPAELDLEDAIALAIFDSVVKPRRRRTRGHAGARRPKPF